MVKSRLTTFVFEENSSSFQMKSNKPSEKMDISMLLNCTLDAKATFTSKNNRSWACFWIDIYNFGVALRLFLARHWSTPYHHTHAFLTPGHFFLFFVCFSKKKLFADFFFKWARRGRWRHSNLSVGKTMALSLEQGSALYRFIIHMR